MTSVTDGWASFIPWVNDASRDEANHEGTWLLYRENGTMLTKDSRFPSGAFTRQYLYDFSGKDAVKVYFCDASVRNKDTLDSRNLNLQDEAVKSFKLLYHFHNLEFATDNSDREKDQENIGTYHLKSSECVHPCEQDMYVGTFDILDEEHYTSLWKVTGPQKSYQILTKYSKHNTS